MFLDKQMFIEYTFTLEDGKVLNYKVDFERKPASDEKRRSYPKWISLTFQQCSNCPLNIWQTPHCPVAVDAYEVISGFNEVLSFREMDVRVKTPEREYHKRCDAQTGLRSLIGFVMATSKCPILLPLRGMAYYHLPFASLEEIVFRVVSSYLLKQYYLHKDDGELDMDLAGLKDQFKDIQTLNYDFLQRIRVASEADASLDVLSTMFSISAFLSSVTLDKHLQEMRPFFMES